MLDVCLLGTGGMMPLPKRWLTSLMTRFNGSSLLIDCGEGTQIAIKECGWTFKQIDIMCITHFHADHISGLPGILHAMANAERTDPLVMIGPRGLEKIVSGLRVIVPELPFEIEYYELSGPEMTFEFCGYHITAFRLNHNTVCYGYSIEIPRQGKFDPIRAKELNIPVRLWNPLQKGEEQEYEGTIYTPDMVLGPPRKGLKVTYSTDSRPTKSIAAHAVDADLFICEGMYGEPDKQVKAREHKHMTMQEAAAIAAEAKPAKMWFTHYSPSMARPDYFIKDIQKIFPDAELGKDGKMLTLLFDDEKGNVQ